MTSMVDQVAMALHDEWNGVGRWSSLTDYDRKRWRFMARAAIEAMREPTDDMLKAGYDKGDDDDAKRGWGEYFSLPLAYEGMIDAALAESKEG